MAQKIVLQDTETKGQYRSGLTMKYRGQSCEVYFERGYLKLGLRIKEDDGSERVEEGGWRRDSERGHLWLAFLVSDGKDQKGEDGLSIVGLGWDPAEALKKLKAEVVR